MNIKDMDDLDNNKEASDFIKAADMKKSTKGKAGRPKKAPEDKQTEQIFANIHKAEKEKVEAFAKDMGISVSSLIKISLKQYGVI
jgi:hypothetical protein